MIDQRKTVIVSSILEDVSGVNNYQINDTRSFEKRSHPGRHKYKGIDQTVKLISLLLRHTQNSPWGRR